MDLLPALGAFLDSHPSGRPDRLVVAFSGGGDSLALLWGLARLAPDRGLSLVAAHLDHGMDPGSAARATCAAALAGKLRVPLVAARRAMSGWRRAGESAEAGARRVRYRFLETVRHDAGARYVLTAHTLDDQAETLLLRLRFGTALAGLAGIRPAAGAVRRPLLAVSRATLRGALAAAGLHPSEDPGNADPRQPRALVRHHLLPALARAGAAAPSPPAPPAAGSAIERYQLSAAAAPSLPPPLPADPAIEHRQLVELLGRVAQRAAGAGAALDRRLALVLGLATATSAPGSDPAPPLGSARPARAMDSGPTQRRANASPPRTADLARLATLPPELWPHALALLHRGAGADWPASRAAVAELARQLRPLSSSPAPPPGAAMAPAPARRVGCDCGGGWRWERRQGQLRLEHGSRGAERDAAPSFTYTLEAPGRLYVPEAAVWMSVRRSAVAPWMWRGALDRVGLTLPVLPPVAGEGGFTVRNRRPGDRLQPLGSPGSRKLKDVLIDHRVPRGQRDRLPLVCWGGEIAWVPGITVDHRFRLADDGEAWVIELTPVAGAATRSPLGESGGNPRRGRAVDEHEVVPRLDGRPERARPSRPYAIQAGELCEVAEL